MWLSLFLITAASAQEDPCPERVAPEAITQQMESLPERVANLSPGVAEELQALFKQTVECVDGPVERRDLGGLLLARGAWGVLSQEVEAEAAKAQMTWAYAIAGRDVYQEVYGWDVQEAFDRATEGVLPRATIDLSFDRDPRVVVIDGEVIYERGPRTVTATFHLVQWLDKKGWHSEGLVLEPGEEALVGSETSSQERRRDAEREAANNAPERPQIRERRGRNRRRPRPPRKKLEGPRLHLQLGGSYGLLMTRFVHQKGASTGGIVLPSANAQVHLDLIHLWGVYTQASMDPGPLSEEYPAMLTRSSAGLRIGKRANESGISLRLGGAFRLAQESTGGGPAEQDPFLNQSLFGGQLGLDWRLSSIAVSLEAEAFPEAYAARFGALYRLPNLEKLGLKPSAGLLLDWVWEDSEARLSDQAYGAQGTLVLERSF